MEKGTNRFNLLFTFVLAIGFLSIGIISLPKANGQLPPETETVTTPTPETSAMITQSVFRENEQSVVLLNPKFDDRSTNIAFYIKCPNVACPDIGNNNSPLYIFSAENTGHGTKPFSDYWAPPALTDYIVIEYKNDIQQFTCSDKTVEECQLDPHFVARFDFALVNNSTTITPEMLALKNPPSEAPTITYTTASSSASDTLKQLSISLSATSITSNLEDGQMVTAILDGISAPTKSTETSEVTEDSSIGEFLLDIVDSVIEIFIPNDPVEPTPEEPAMETLIEPVAPDAQPTENEIQSSIFEDEKNSEITTSEF